MSRAGKAFRLLSWFALVFSFAFMTGCETVLTVLDDYAAVSELDDENEITPTDSRMHCFECHQPHYR